MSEILVDRDLLGELESCLKLAKLGYEAALARIAELEAEVKELDEENEKLKKLNDRLICSANEAAF